MAGMAGMCFNPRAGWLQWRDMALSSEWKHCWCIVSRDAVQVMENEESEELLDEYDITRATRAHRKIEEEVPAPMVGVLAGRKCGFALCGAGGERAACFDAYCDEDLEMWMVAINEAAAAPRELEAYIDDFSDVEDDAHARRCSLDALDAADWSCLVDDGRMCTKGSEQSDFGMKKVVSVTVVRLDDCDEGDDAARRSSLEAVLDMDWANIGTSAAHAEAADAGLATPRSTTAESDESDDDGGDAISQAWKAEAKEAGLRPKGQFDVLEHYTGKDGSQQPKGQLDFDADVENFGESSSSEPGGEYDEVYGECW